MRPAPPPATAAAASAPARARARTRKDPNTARWGRGEPRRSGGDAARTRSPHHAPTARARDSPVGRGGTRPLSAVTGLRGILSYTYTGKTARAALAHTHAQKETTNKPRVFGTIFALSPLPAPPSPSLGPPPRGQLTPTVPRRSAARPTTAPPTARLGVGAAGRAAGTPPLG